MQTPYVRAKAPVSGGSAPGVRNWKVVDLDKGRPVVPITEAEAPNAFVSVVTVKGGGNAGAGVPHGLRRLRVETSKKVLRVDVSADRGPIARARPRPSWSDLGREQPSAPEVSIAGGG